MVKQTLTARCGGRTEKSIENTRTPMGSSMLIASAASSRDPELQ